MSGATPTLVAEILVENIVDATDFQQE